jgi:hypothetical protein
VKISKYFTTALLKALLVFKGVTIFGYILFSPIKQKHVFPPKKGCASSSAAQHAATPHHWGH